MTSDGAPVIVFDGVCLLCNRWVDFILRNDRVGRFRLAAMQGEHGRQLLQAHRLSADDPLSFLLLRDPAYRWVARHRYRLFGRRAQCRLPDPALAARFLD